MATDNMIDLFALCGVEEPKVEPKAAREKVRPESLRHTNWNNLHTFTFGGYVARVFRTRCTLCDGVQDTLEGVFIEEIHAPSGTRRMQQLARGAQWPAQGGHRKEITDQEVDLCATCVGDLGFDREVDSKGQPYTLLIKEERRK